MMKCNCACMAKFHSLACWHIIQLNLFNNNYLIYPLTKAKIPVTNDIFIIGKPSKVPALQPKELDLLTKNGISLPSYYPKLYLQSKSRTITTCSASKAKKRIDYCVMYEADIRGVTLYKYGLIQKLLISSSGCFVILTPLHESTEYICNNHVAIVWIFIIIIYHAAHQGQLMQEVIIKVIVFLDLMI